MDVRTLWFSFRFTILKVFMGNDVKISPWPKKSKSLRAVIDMLSSSEPISSMMKKYQILRRYQILRNHICYNFLTYFICFSEAWLELKWCSLDGCMGHRGSDEKVNNVLQCITSIFCVVAIFRICWWFDGEILPNYNKSNRSSSLGMK